jgi:toxin FitB
LIRYLIDTNVASEMRKRRPHGGVSAWMQTLGLAQVFFSAVTFGEIQRGVELIRRQDPEKASQIEIWADHLERSSQVLVMDSVCFREYARLMHGRSSMLAEDAMIAATARVHDLTIATRNERDFVQFGVSLVNPFRATP